MWKTLTHYNICVKLSRLMDAKTSGITDTDAGNKIYTEENKRALKKGMQCTCGDDYNQCLELYL